MSYSIQQIFLKNGVLRIDTLYPYIVDIKIGLHINKYNVVYHADYYAYDKSEPSGSKHISCCFVKHDTMHSRSLDRFKKIEKWEDLIVKGEVFNSVTGSNMSIEDDDRK